MKLPWNNVESRDSSHLKRTAFSGFPCTHYLKRLRQYFYTNLRNSQFFLMVAALIWYFGVVTYAYSIGLKFVPLFEIEFLLIFISPYTTLTIFLLCIPRTFNIVALSFGYESFFDFSYLLSRYYTNGWEGYTFFSVFAITTCSFLIYSSFNKKTKWDIKNRVVLIFIYISLILAGTVIERIHPQQINIVGFPFLNYYRQFSNFTPTQPRFYDIENWKGLKPDGNESIHFFIIESHAPFTDAKLNEELYSGLGVFFNKARIETGTVQYGGTLRGEFRELCGVIFYPDITPVELPSNLLCLPAAYNNTHRTVAVHGGTKGMYRRQILYSQIGFQEYYSIENFPDISPCGGGWSNFPCDISILNEFERNNKMSSKPYFLYMLTLNTHNPYKLTSYALPDCPERIRQEEQLCVHYRNVGGFLSYIREFAKRNPGKYIITGDHPPPFLQKYYQNDSYQRIIFTSVK